MKSTYNQFRHWWQQKIVWFRDDNLTIDRAFARELLTALIPCKKWWLSQASMDVAKDANLLDLTAIRWQSSGYGAPMVEVGSVPHVRFYEPVLLPQASVWQRAH